MESPPQVIIFAGPNGSGKSTLYKEFCSRYPVPCFINADHVEKDFREKGFFNLSEYKLKVSEEEIAEFAFFLQAAGEPDSEGFYSLIKIIDSVFRNFPDNPNTDEAALIAFLRRKCVMAGHTFAFETVLSHPSRIKEIELAKAAGYTTNLYYIGTQSPLINVYRIRNRSLMGGHAVNQEKVISRYQTANDLLLQAIRISSHAFIFDNSGKECVLLAEFEAGKLLRMHFNQQPQWFKESVLDRLG